MAVKYTEREIGYIDADLGRVLYPFCGGSFKLTPEEQIRLIFVRRLVLEYGYDPEQLGLEVPVKAGAKTLPKRADIVVFSSGKDHDPASQAYVIVEVKKKDRQDGVDQMQTYCNNTTAEFGVWFNGTDVVYQHRKRAPHKFDDIPDIPRAGEKLEDVGLFLKKNLVPATELKSVFETIHNHIYANEGVLKDKAFNEMLKLIFMKMVDEQGLGEKSEFRITEGELRAVEDGKGEDFLKRLGGLFERVRKDYGDVFEKTETLRLKPLTMAFVVSRLQRYSLRATPADVKGTAFQTFVSAHQRGDRGEFFTPHAVLELMVKMMDPSDQDTFIDPACGSGGFLVYGMNHVWDKFRASGRAREVDMIKYAHHNIRGIDFNPDLAKVAKMYMVLYDDGHTGIFSADSLDRWAEIKKKATAAGVIGVEPGAFDLVLTNPPFGSKGKVSSKTLLQQYDLGYHVKKEPDGRYTKTKKRRESQIPDVLFVERCLDLLRPGGRMGIVLPNSDLNNINLDYVRRFIRGRARILAVVGLPVGTFASAGANPHPSVVFVQKLASKEAAALNKKGYPVFMAKAERLGFVLSTKNAPVVFLKDAAGELVVDTDGRPVIDTDIPEIVEAFRRFRADNGIVFHEGEFAASEGSAS